MINIPKVFNTSTPKIFLKIHKEAIEAILFNLQAEKAICCKSPRIRIYDDECYTSRGEYKSTKS